MSEQPPSAEKDAGRRDLCAGCGTALRTLANCIAVGDEIGLAATWMPPGGCTCAGVLDGDADPGCRRCFPAALSCSSCGDASGKLQLALSFDGGSDA